MKKVVASALVAFSLASIPDISYAEDNATIERLFNAVRPTIQSQATREAHFVRRSTKTAINTMITLMPIGSNTLRGRLSTLVLSTHQNTLVDAVSMYLGASWERYARSKMELALRNELRIHRGRIISSSKTRQAERYVQQVIKQLRASNPEVESFGPPRPNAFY